MGISDSAKSLLRYYKNRPARLAQVRRYRTANREAIRAAKKAYNILHRVEINRKNREYKRAHKKEIRCHNLAAKAVRQGKLMPKDCEDCGALTSENKIVKHHLDYSNPLEVIWLCIPCHQQRHRGLVFRKGCMTSEKLQELLG